MLTSISRVIWQKNQANYASANSFLYAFAIYRQSEGLRACNVDLGVIEDVDYIAEREDLAARLDNSNIELLNLATTAKSTEPEVNHTAYHRHTNSASSWSRVPLRCSLLSLVFRN